MSISLWADTRENLLTVQEPSLEGRTVVVVIIQPVVPLNAMLKLIQSYFSLASGQGVDMIVEIRIDIGA